MRALKKPPSLREQEQGIGVGLHTGKHHRKRQCSGHTIAGTSNTTASCCYIKGGNTVDSPCDVLLTREYPVDL